MLCVFNLQGIYIFQNKIKYLYLKTIKSFKKFYIVNNTKKIFCLYELLSKKL